ncbi:MAG: xanthine dehydrogenase family protein subunit M [Burkholderiales bacterium]|nr:xanthine dehydrogenase family protein subunit M [Burkholderiales bacterium]
MKRLTPFSYFEPATLAEAVEILSGSKEKAYLLAGGTDLLIRMKRGEIAPPALVNLKRISGLSSIEREGQSGIRIGALTTIAEIEHSSALRASHTLMAEAATALGSPSIRNLATLGGNIGRASPASDMAPSLIVLKARLNISGPRGNKQVGLESFFTGPGTTILQPGELITSVFLPDPAARSGAAYLKLGRGGGMDCALGCVAIFLTLGNTDTEVKEVLVAVGACSAIPMRANKTEALILSGSLTDGHIQEAAMAVAAETSPITDLRASESYRRQMVQVLFSRALKLSWSRARSSKDTH